MRRSNSTLFRPWCNAEGGICYAKSASVPTLGKRCNVPLLCIKYRLLMKARGNSLCHTDLTSGVDAVFITRPSPRGSTTSLCWGQGACLQDTGTPVAYWAEVDSKPQYQWLNVLSRVSWREESLSAMPNGRTEENRQGGRKNTGGYYRSCTGLIDPTRAAVLQSSSGVCCETPEDDSIFLLLLVFQFVDFKSHNFTATLKKNQYTIQRKCVNHWTDGKLLARGRGSQQDHLQHVKWSGFQWWQTDKRSPQQPSVFVGRIHMRWL